MNKCIISNGYKLHLKTIFLRVGAVDLPPVFLYTPAQGDLLAHLRAHWVREDDLCQISLDSTDAAACRQGADVHHQHLVLGQLLNLRGQKNAGTVSGRSERTQLRSSSSHLGSLLVALCADPQQPPEQEVGNLQLGEDLRQRANSTQHLADHTVRSAKRRVDFSAHTCTNHCYSL